MTQVSSYRSKQALEFVHSFFFLCFSTCYSIILALAGTFCFKSIHRFLKLKTKNIFVHGIIVVCVAGACGRLFAVLTSHLWGFGWEWEGGGAMERIKILQLQRMVREVSEGGGGKTRPTTWMISCSLGNFRRLTCLFLGFYFLTSRYKYVCKIVYVCDVLFFFFFPDRILSKISVLSGKLTSDQRCRGGVEV